MSFMLDPSRVYLHLKNLHSRWSKQQNKAEQRSFGLFTAPMITLILILIGCRRHGSINTHIHFPVNGMPMAEYTLPAKHMQIKTN